MFTSDRLLTCHLYAWRSCVRRDPTNTGSAFLRHSLHRYLHPRRSQSHWQRLPPPQPVSLRFLSPPRLCSKEKCKSSAALQQAYCHLQSDVFFCGRCQSRGCQPPHVHFPPSLRWGGTSLIPPQGGTILCSGRPVSRVPLSHGAPHTSARVVVGCLVHLYTRQV